MKYLLSNKSIEELFINNKEKQSLSAAYDGIISDKDLLSIAEFKLRYIEKNIEIIKYMIKSKKNNEKNAINNFKIIKGRDILEKIGSIEEVLGEGLSPSKFPNADYPKSDVHVVNRILEHNNANTNNDSGKKIEDKEVKSTYQMFFGKETNMEKNLGI